jgi:hypothetical protein
MLPSLLAQLSSSLVLLSSLTRPSSLALLFSPAQLSSSPAPISSLDWLSS